MNEVIIAKQDLSHIVKKSDVWIVYMKDNKHWVCEVGGVMFDGSLVTLKLATKGKCEAK